MHCLWDPQILFFFFSGKTTSKLGSMTLFTYLKIILLHYFQFSVFHNKRYPNTPFFFSIFFLLLLLLLLLLFFLSSSSFSFLKKKKDSLFLPLSFSIKSVFSSNLKKISLPNFHGSIHSPSLSQGGGKLGFWVDLYFAKWVFYCIFLFYLSLSWVCDDFH